MSLAEIIDTTDGCAMYDSCAKKLISHKAVLAWILKYCAKEFASYSIEYIRDHCIEGDAEISTKAVDQDVKSESRIHSGLIQGMNNEDSSIREGTVYYDICFSACLPGETPVQMIINLEIQQNTNLGYPLVKRGFYYCSRLISAQRGTIFTGDNYEKLRKVYSIWICPKPAKKAANKIRRYRTIEEFLGEEAPCLPNGENIPLPPEAYDLMEVVILYPSEDGKNNDRNDILHLLNILFSNKISPEEKKVFCRINIISQWKKILKGM